MKKFQVVFDWVHPMYDGHTTDFDGYSKALAQYKKEKEDVVFSLKNAKSQNRYFKGTIVVSLERKIDEDGNGIAIFKKKFEC